MFSSSDIKYILKINTFFSSFIFPGYYTVISFSLKLKKKMRLFN